MTPNAESTLTSPGRSIAWIDRLLGAVFRWVHAPLIKQAGGEVARESHPAAWERIFPTVRNMGPAQVRGYARAVVPDFVAREVDVVMARRWVRASLRAQVVAEAIEQLTKLIVDDVACAQSRPVRAARQTAA
ncbi:MAG: hypothetical protein ABSF26_30645 [Thermoguttaceae bacterium]|jgi:hypothetical protein